MLLHLEIQKGKKVMAQAKHKSKKKAAACCLRMSEESVRTTNLINSVERSIPKQTFLGDSWFTFIQTATESALLGHHFVGVLKLEHSPFPKQFIVDTMQLSLAVTDNNTGTD